MHTAIFLIALLASFANAYPNPLPMKGDITSPQGGSPTLCKQDDTYYLFSERCMLFMSYTLSYSVHSRRCGHTLLHLDGYGHLEFDGTCMARRRRLVDRRIHWGPEPQALGARLHCIGRCDSCVSSTSLCRECLLNVIHSCFTAHPPLALNTYVSALI